MLGNTVTSSLNILAHRYWTLATASFSHHAWDRLLGNMIGLAIYAPAFYTAGGVGIGASHVIRLTIGSAVVSNLASLVYRWPEPRDHPDAKEDDIPGRDGTHGASGVVNAFATAATCLTPDKCIAIGRFTLPFPMWFITVNFIIHDMVMLDSGDTTAHEAHLMGATYGLAYYMIILRKSFGWRHLIVR